ncbi:hypothetical protein AK830_g4083 [Neonectria ditissima]|uniref:F-box domain-containing protein n=1 Tax=Neonectria ditissima TaxID=78410 RepID=A0A0P7AWU0_9HYPO|nr:hypothetical protein AK830_g4083 [Neonectria ditissima]
MLFNFPAEILLMITDNLPIASLIQLALACKPLHAILFPTGEFPDLSKADKAVTLSMLAKDQPNMVVCFDCFRLRPFEYNDAIGWEAHRHQGCTEELRPYPRGRGRSATWHRAYNLRRYMWQYWGSRNEGTALDFSEVYSVMKRHFCGATHGLPLSGLRQSFSFERYLSSSNGQISNTCHFPLHQHRPGKLHYTRLLRKLAGDQAFPCPGHRYSVPQAFGVGEVRRKWHESHGETFDDQTIPHWVDSHLKMNDNNPETNHNVR